MRKIPNIKIPAFLKIKKKSNSKYKKWIPTLKILLILLIPISVMLGVANNVIFDKELYGKEFEKVGTYERVPNADDIMGEILLFFEGDVTNLNITDITIEETTHMHDVKSLIWNFIFIFYVLIIIKLIFFGIIIFQSTKPIKDIVQITLGSGILTIGSPLMFASMDFSFLFTEFHELLFSQGGWQFVESSILIQLFPEQFFMNMSEIIGRQSIIVGVALISFALTLYYVTREE